MNDQSIGTAIHELAETLQREANVRAVFGEPISVGSLSLVPVAVVSIGGGGGSGHGPALGTSDTRGAAAMGLGVTVIPIGFIHEDGGKLVYTAITGAREGSSQAAAAAVGSEAGHLGARVLAALHRHKKA